MPRLFTEKTLLIASNNAHKLKELSALFTPFSVTLASAATYNLEEPEETGSSFAENAALKAKYYGEKTGLPALADDSGLAVEALQGAPGIYSARWAGPEKNFVTAMEKVRIALEEQQAKTPYRASFRCALALWWPDGHREQVEGKVEGTLCFPPRGAKGFGYDPIFIPDGYALSFGEMAAEQKNAISHRTDAFNQLIQRCFKAVA